MNAANFHEYLKNPSMLHQVNYQELKSLSLQYPYAANLRYLMLVKSLMENKREYDRNLTLASLSSIDRKKLRQLVMMYSVESKAKDNYEIAEEFLELKDLSTLEEVLEVTPDNRETLQQQAAPLDTGAGSALEFLDNLDEEGRDESVEKIDTADTEKSNLPVLEDLLEEKAIEIDSTEEPIVGDDLLVESHPGEAESEAITPQDLGDVDDYEIEESLDGLFEEPEEGTALVDGTEEIMSEVAVPQQFDSHNSTDAAQITDDVQDATEEITNDEETPLLVNSSIPLEITNDEPPTESIEGDVAASANPVPKTAFSSYQQVHLHKTGLLAGGLDIFKKESKETPATSDSPPPTAKVYEEPEDVAKEVAASSLSEDNTIATETLAGILERQGHFNKAIRMYEKLSLQFPEKSSTFAAKIEKLRKK